MNAVLLDCVSDPGDRDTPNEDVAGSTASSAWVLDGATGLGDDPLLPGVSDAVWLAAAYDARLRAEADDIGREPRRLLADLITGVGAEFAGCRSRSPAARFELPSAGMAFVRVRASSMEYARLGDCRAILALSGGTDGVISTGDSPLRDLDAAVIRKMEALRLADPSLDHGRLRRAVRGQLRANRALLNTEEGYWALADDPEAAYRMEVGTVPVEGQGPARALLMTDGFYRLVDTFHAYPDDTTLLRAALKDGLTTLLTELRALEDEDPDCSSHPRLKPKDDATALLLEFAGGS